MFGSRWPKTLGPLKENAMHIGLQIGSSSFIYLFYNKNR